MPPGQGDWRKNCWEECQKAVCFIPFLEDWDSLTGFSFLHGFCVKQEQPVCKLHCSLGLEQGEYLLSRDFVVNFVVAVLEH